MRAPPYEFTPDELAALREDRGYGLYEAVLTAAESGDEKCTALAKNITSLRFMAPDLTVEQTLLLCAEEFRALVLSLPGGEIRRQNLEILAGLARQYEKTWFQGLGGFGAYVREHWGRTEPGANTGGGDAVRILSIHRAKGLEFPVVFISDLARRFNREDARGPAPLHPALGPGLRVRDKDTPGIAYDTLARSAVLLALEKERLAEEMRLLYVAMTRARDMLFLTLAPRHEKSLRQRLRAAAVAGARESAALAGCLGDWVLTALACHPDGQCMQSMDSLAPFRHQGALFTISCSAAPGDFFHAPVRKNPEQAASAPMFSESEIRAALAYVYPHEPAAFTPSKQTAAAITPDPFEKGRYLDSEAAEGTGFARPAFVRGGSELTAAERGSALHLTLQFCEYAACVTAEGAGREVRRLLEKELLTPEQAAAVDTAALARFFSGEWGRALREAKHILREHKFTLLKPLPELPGESVLLQGVIDCAFRPGDGTGWTILDFKTGGRGGMEQYRAQIKTYAEALEAMTGYAVHRRVLYFFSSGEGVEV
jgi:ATP-dependent helicase/nuclease subunit A